MKTTILSISLVFAFICCTAQTEIPLEQKRFSKNWFSNMDKAQANADSVFYLDLSLQKLKTFPKEIFKFKNLRELYLSYNYWETLPEGWGALTQVTVLDFSGNYFLKKLPTDLANMKALKQLDLKDNLLNKGEADKVTKALPNVKVSVTEHKAEVK